jgi:putative PIN family toxin of toxin-antitoxin system
VTAASRRKGSPLRVVLDTNVVLSALLFRSGAAGALRLAWQSGACLPLVGTATVQELMRVLAYPKFRLTPAEQHELLGDYLPFARTVPIPLPPPKVPECRDPFDLPFLHLAIAGKAAMLVSGDRDLLALAGRFPVPVLGLSEFLARLHEPSAGS